MTTGTETKAKAETTRGFAVRCPFCQDEDAELTIDLKDLSAITCQCCDETFTPAEAVAKVREQLAAWERLAAWVEMAPAKESD